MTMHRLCCAAALSLLTLLCAQSAGAQHAGVLARRYREGDSLHYEMVATNAYRDRVLRYSARAVGVVQRDSLGHFVEDFEWSALVRNDSAVALPAGTASVHERLSLAPEVVPAPDIRHTSPLLVGPALDLLTFYVDVWLAAKLPLGKAGDHLRVPGPGATSWADGQVVTLGEDAIDFDVTLTAIDSLAKLARLTVRHVPPDSSRVRLPADWMRGPLYATPNNWVEITRRDETYVAAVGRESFEVQLDVRLGDGRIVAAHMDNPVDVLERTCTDAVLLRCGAPVRYRIVRTIALRSEAQ